MIARCGTARTEYASNFPRRYQRVALLVASLALSIATVSAQTYNYFATYPNTGTWQSSNSTQGGQTTNTAYYTGSVPDGTTHYDAALTFSTLTSSELGFIFAEANSATLQGNTSQSCYYQLLVSGWEGAAAWTLTKVVNVCRRRSLPASATLFAGVTHHLASVTDSAIITRLCHRPHQSYRSFFTPTRTAAHSPVPPAIETNSTLLTARRP